jgi:hypothetical protein
MTTEQGLTVIVVLLISIIIFLWGIYNRINSMHHIRDSFIKKNRNADMSITDCLYAINVKLGRIQDNLESNNQSTQ